MNGSWHRVNEYAVVIVVAKYSTPTHGYFIWTIWPITSIKLHDLVNVNIGLERNCLISK